MIRTPLRPLARILEARQKGENPDAIERENKRIRHEQMRGLCHLGQPCRHRGPQRQPAGDEL
jgi:hypothetical protein